MSARTLKVCLRGLRNSEACASSAPLATMSETPLPSTKSTFAGKPILR